MDSPRTIVFIMKAEGRMKRTEESKLKKIGIGILTVIMVLFMGTASAFAADWGPGFIDEDGDGICDNYGVYCRGGAPGFGCSRGRFFIDLDGDGICDNYISVVGRQAAAQEPGQSAAQEPVQAQEQTPAAAQEQPSVQEPLPAQGYGWGCGRGCGRGYGRGCGRYR